jgi:DNA-binding XRE family transcriptional regulator
MEKGIFQRDLAKVIGVNEITIVNWEKGQTRPARDKILKINSIWKIWPGFF